MQYFEISDTNEIPTTIEAVRRICGGLNNAVFAGDRENTMSGRQVISVFLRFEVVAKIEATKELLDQLMSRFEEKKSGSG